MPINFSASSLVITGHVAHIFREKGHAIIFVHL